MLWMQSLPGARRAAAEEAEEKREMRVEALPDWLEINPQGQPCGDSRAAIMVGQLAANPPGQQ
jgi:hypothetical protein